MKMILENDWLWKHTYYKLSLLDISGVNPQNIQNVIQRGRSLRLPKNPQCQYTKIILNLLRKYGRINTINSNHEYLHVKIIYEIDDRVLTLIVWVYLIAHKSNTSTIPHNFLDKTEDEMISILEPLADRIRLREFANRVGK